jgi:hypothetical protein
VHPFNYIKRTHTTKANRTFFYWLNSYPNQNTMKINTKKVITVLTGLALAGSVALPAFADTNNGQNNSWRGQGRGDGAPGRMIDRANIGRPAVGGVVTAISGTTITLSGHLGGVFSASTTNTATTYTIDAAGATVRKNNATSSVSNIAVGDRIFVQGTVSGTTVTATSIYDGVGAMMGERGRGGWGGPNSSTTPPFVGNGQPVVAGNVTAINGSTLTVTTTSNNVSYTVDASNAKIVQGSSTISLSDITVGQRVVIQGTVNGAAVNASTIIDQAVPGLNGQGHGNRFAFFDGIGNFFKHLFGL